MFIFLKLNFKGSFQYPVVSSALLRRVHNYCNCKHFSFVSNMKMRKLKDNKQTINKTGTVFSQTVGKVPLSRSLNPLFTSHKPLRRKEQIT